MELAGRTLTVDIGRSSKLSGKRSYFIKYGDITVLSTASTASDKPRDGVDFSSLSVEFEEDMIMLCRKNSGWF